MDLLRDADRLSTASLSSIELYPRATILSRLQPSPSHRRLRVGIRIEERYLTFAMVHRLYGREAELLEDNLGKI